jgi:hypothetical protein
MKWVNEYIVLFGANSVIISLTALLEEAIFEFVTGLQNNHQSKYDGWNE